LNLELVFFPLLAAALWGAMYVVSKASFGAVPPLTLAGLRLAIGGGCLWLFLRASGQPAPGRSPRERLWLLGLGALVALSIGTQFLGTDLVNAQQGALLTTSSPIFVILFAWLLLRERIGRPTIAGNALALLGVIGVVTGGRGEAAGEGTLLGQALLLLSAAGWALFTVLGKPLVRAYSALPTVTYATLAGLPFFLPTVPLELAARPPAPLTPMSIAALLYLSLGSTALAWWAWYKGLERLDASATAVCFFAQPAVGGLLAWLFLGEQPTWALAAGGALIAVGIVLATRGANP
jgi:drug/metabolite transporter (DMT)-like permease